MRKAKQLVLDDLVLRLVQTAAGARGKSANAWIRDAIQAALLRQAADPGPEGRPVAAVLDELAEGRVSIKA